MKHKKPLDKSKAVLMAAMVLSMPLAIEAMAQPLLQFKDQQVTKNVTGSPDDEGFITGCVVKHHSDDWQIKGYSRDLTACEGACAYWSVLLQRQTVGVGYEEGCADPGPLIKAIDNEIVLTFDIINTLQESLVSFPLGATTMRSFVANRENGALEQNNYIFLEDSTGKKLAGKSYSHAIGSGPRYLHKLHLQFAFPQYFYSPIFPEPERNKHQTVIAGGMTGEVRLVMRADDFVEVYGFNDQAYIDEYPLYPGESVSTSRMQALIGVTASDGILPDATDSDGDYWADQIDNCTFIANTDQRDPDADGYGAICDGDFNNDGVTDAADQNILKAAAFSVEGHANYNPNVDMDGDGDIDSADVVIFRDYLGLPPGPSWVSQ